MKEKQVSDHNLQEFMSEIQNEIAEHKLVIVSSQPMKVGKWGMARLWRAWMETTAKFMAGNGVTMPLMINKDGALYGSRPFNKDDAHNLFTRQHLGSDELGRRLSWAKSIKKEDEDKSRVATKGERFDALRKHEDWCVEKGISLFKPRDSEYEQIEQEQNK